MDAQRGIRKPRIFQAALSIRTVFRKRGQDRPYEDGIGPDQLYRYKWRGVDPMHPENRALRRAMELELPLIYFDGFAEGVYAAIFPIYLVAEEPELQQFVLAVDELQLGWTHQIPQSALERRIRLRLTRQRLHQPRFRAGVMRAYDMRCAICELNHGELLDAAHIIPDADSSGDPVTSNGLSLCKIHHSAYDANIIGVAPDLEIAVNPKILAEVDGPMLKHGIQGIHGQRLSVVPRARADQPDPDRLRARFEEFMIARK
jgi:putative restriction endonuclease